MRNPNEQRMFNMLLDEIEETLNDFEQRCLRLETSEYHKELEVMFRGAHNVKGAAQLYGLTSFGEFVHVVEDLISALQTQPKLMLPESVDLLLRAHTQLSNWVKNLRTTDDFTPPLGSLKSDVKHHIEELKAGRFEEPAPTGKESPDLGTFPVEPGTKQADLQTATNPGTKEARAKKRTSNLRVSSTKIDQIMQLIGELSIQQSILWHGHQSNTLSSSICKNAVSLNQKSLKELHALILTLRMQPVETLFQRIERVARELARDLSKQLKVNLVGSDIPLDKTVIELVMDPMVHLVRNAIDHGIETPKERVKNGKPETASLTIEAHQDAGQVVISISDDGAGINPDRIWEKALSKNLVHAGQKLSEEEIIQLIFLPGFSTKEEVSAISGRGIGMDVVQQAIQQLGGRIETRTHVGHGTTFLIHLPTSLEIIDGLVCKVAGNVYIVPTQSVVEIVDLKSLPVEKVGDGGLAVSMRNDLVPIEPMSDYIGVDDRKGARASTVAPAMNSPQSNSVALIIRLRDRTRLALKVDEIISQSQIVVRPLHEQIEQIPGFTGMTILGDGEPAMIVSLEFVGECYLKWAQRGAYRDGRAA